MVKKYKFNTSDSESSTSDYDSDERSSCNADAEVQELFEQKYESTIEQTEESEESENEYDYKKGNRKIKYVEAAKGFTRCIYLGGAQMDMIVMNKNNYVNMTYLSDIGYDIPNKRDHIWIKKLKALAEHLHIHENDLIIDYETYEEHEVEGLYIHPTLLLSILPYTQSYTLKIIDMLNEFSNWNNSISKTKNVSCFNTDYKKLLKKKEKFLVKKDEYLTKSSELLKDKTKLLKKQNELLIMRAKENQQENKNQIVVNCINDCMFSPIFKTSLSRIETKLKQLKELILDLNNKLNKIDDLLQD